MAVVQILIVASLLVFWSTEAVQVCDTDAAPESEECRFEQHQPRTMFLFSTPQCGTRPAGEAVIGERIFSAKKVYDTSNEAELCYSLRVTWDPHVGSPEHAPNSVKWVCDTAGMQLTSIPYASMNCTGQPLEDKDNKKFKLDSSMWSGILDGKMCLTAGGGVLGQHFLSFRLNASFEASARPLCVQSWGTMEEQINALYEDVEYAEYKVQKQSQARSKDLDKQLVDKWKILALGIAIGIAVGGITAVGCMRCLRCCRRSGSRGPTLQEDIYVAPLDDQARELSCSMLAAEGAT